MEASWQRTHLIGTSLHQASRKTAAGSQRNAGIGHGEGGTQTPRTKDNDCDVGTYRQVRPTFPKRTDAKTMNGGFHIERYPKREGRKRRVYPGGCTLIGQMEVSGQRTHLIGTSLHQASRKTAAGGQRNAGIKNNIYSELNTNFNLYVSKRFFTRLNLIIKICIKICIKILTIRKKYRNFANQRCNKDENTKGQTIINACCYR